MSGKTIILAALLGFSTTAATVAFATTSSVGGITNVASSTTCANLESNYQSTQTIINNLTSQVGFTAWDQSLATAISAQAALNSGLATAGVKLNAPAPTSQIEQMHALQKTILTQMAQNNQAMYKAIKSMCLHATTTNGTPSNTQTTSTPATTNSGAMINNMPTAPTNGGTATNLRPVGGAVAAH